MPTAPMRPCNQQGCPRLSHAAYCPVHRKRDTRPSAAQRGYGAEWQRISRKVRARHPYCQSCGLRRATEVHHLRAVADGGGNERSNLSALCHSCHVKATHAQQAARSNR